MPTILSLFRGALHRRAGVKPGRPRCSVDADLRQPRRRFIELTSPRRNITSVSRPGVWHHQDHIVAAWIARVGRACIAALSLHQAGIDHVTNFDLRRHRRDVSSSSRRTPRRPAPSRRLMWGSDITLPTCPATSDGPRLRHCFINLLRGLQCHFADLLRHLGWIGGFISPHRQCCVATLSSRALRLATSGPDWGLGPRPATSPDRVISTGSIKPAKSLSCSIVFNFCSV